MKTIKETKEVTFWSWNCLLIFMKLTFNQHADQQYQAPQCRHHQWHAIRALAWRFTQSKSRWRLAAIFVGRINVSSSPTTQLLHPLDYDNIFNCASARPWLYQSAFRISSTIAFELFSLQMDMAGRIGSTLDAFWQCEMAISSSIECFLLFHARAEPKHIITN